MKKTILFLFLLSMVSSIPAATLKWGFGSTDLFITETGVGNATLVSEYTGDLSGSLVLVYLGAESSMNISSISASMVVDSMALAANGSMWSPNTKSISIDAAGGYSVGDNFGVAFFDGAKYSAILDISNYDTGALGSALLPTISVTDLSATKSFTITPGPSSTDAAAAVHVAAAVPEPATGALALAGIALLLKRRKAVKA